MYLRLCNNKWVPRFTGCMVYEKPQLRLEIHASDGMYRDATAAASTGLTIRICSSEYTEDCQLDSISRVPSCSSLTEIIRDLPKNLILRLESGRRASSDTMRIDYHQRVYRVRSTEVQHIRSTKCTPVLQVSAPSTSKKPPSTSSHLRSII